VQLGIALGATLALREGIIALRVNPDAVTRLAALHTVFLPPLVNLQAPFQRDAYPLIDAILKLPKRARLN